MYANKIFVICGAFVIGKLVASENSRNAKFLTFNTVDDDVLEVKLEFDIPFIRIPTKKTLDSAVGLWPNLPTININPTALAVAGAVMLSTVVVLPLLLKTFTHSHPEKRYSRLLDNAEFSTDAVLDFASQLLNNSQAIHGCTLRVACWIAQRYTKTEAEKIWSHLMSNALLSSMVNSTAIEDAMLGGTFGRDCTSYSPCPLKEQHVPMLMSNLAVFANSIGSH